MDGLLALDPSCASTAALILVNTALLLGRYLDARLGGHPVLPARKSTATLRSPRKRITPRKQKRQDPR